MRLTEEDLREMLAPLGVIRIQLDPVLVGPDVRLQAAHPAESALVH